MSQNDDFWSGSQNDPYGNQPPGQSPHFGDADFGAPQNDPYRQDPYQQDPYRQDPYRQDPYRQDPYQQDPYQQGGQPGDPYQQEQQRRKLLATGPHEFGDSWSPEDPFEESFTPPRDGRRGGGGGGRGGGGGSKGFIAAFAMAALLVALAAGAYAIYSVLQDSDGASDEPFLTDTTTSSSVATTTTLATTTTAPPPPGLNIVLNSPDFVCDGTAKEFGTISGATPDEEIAFSSPQSPNLRSGQADASGQLPIRWSCGPEQIGMIWELTATGVESGLAGTVVFTGVAEGETSAQPDPTETTVTTTVSELGDLAITITENPFACNGEARVFGTISGATPNGTISFTSPQASNIGSGTADETGNRAVRWQCDTAQSGTIWQLTATDDATGRTVVWELTGN